MGVFVQVVINGIATGSLYGLLALALVMAWKATGVLNFAQAEIALFGVFVIWWSMSVLGLPFVLAGVLGILAGCALAVFIERVTIRPLIGQSHFATVLMTIG